MTASLISQVLPTDLFIDPGQSGSKKVWLSGPDPDNLWQGPENLRQGPDNLWQGPDNLWQSPDNLWQGQTHLMLTPLLILINSSARMSFTMIIVSLIDRACLNDVFNVRLTYTIHHGCHCSNHFVKSNQYLHPLHNSIIIILSTIITLWKGEQELYARLCERIAKQWRTCSSRWCSP